ASRSSPIPARRFGPASYPWGSQLLTFVKNLRGLVFFEKDQCCRDQPEQRQKERPEQHLYDRHAKGASGKSWNWPGAISLSWRRTSAANSRISASACTECLLNSMSRQARILPVTTIRVSVMF